MFLKSLDVLGFKSFAERIVMDFVPGVTAVVGPNGSGKSNITDAIRWVLGEQSAKSLRGGKMEDVIFAGSDSRKPLNFAEVTLTLDNEDQALPLDFAEVSVTRRVFRSGDSEYLLNNQACRLKDIIDLFIDSGLGKEAFSIIGQGRVEQILNSKPEERRVILEEAAGVLKYKNRRKKADLRLVETQENLYRVEDILHELEGQVEPLKIQSSIAKEYLEKKEELKRTEVALLVHDIEEMNSDWEKSKEKHIEIDRQQKQKQTLINDYEELLAQKRSELKQCDLDIEELQKELLSLTEEAEQLDGRRQVLIERRKNANQNEEQMKQTMSEINEQLTRSERAVKENKKQVEENATYVKTVANEVKKLQQSLKLLEENIEEQLEMVKNDYFDLLTKKTTIKNELSYSDQQLEQQEKRTNKLHGENSQYIEERNKWLHAKENKNFELQKVEDDLQQTTSRLSTTQEKVKTQKTEYEQLEEKLYKAYQFVSEAKSRRTMLETMEEDFSGFFQGVKEVLKARTTKLNGIEGAIAELITVEKNLELAIETALGGSMQSIVTETEKDARDAIQFLKQNKFGRATFLPMSVIKPKLLQSHQLQIAKQHSSFIDVGSSIVSYNKRHETIVTNLLGNVLIVKDLQGANELATKLQHRFRFVTVEGDIVNPGGSMTGGAQSKKGASLLSRKNELDHLTTQIPEMEKTSAALEQKVKVLKNSISSLEKEVEHHRSVGESLRIKESEIKSSIREVEASLERTDDRLSLYDLEMNEFKGARKELTEKKDSLAEQLSSMDGELALLNEKMKTLTDKKEFHRTSKDNLIEKLSLAQSSFAVAKEQQLQFAREKEGLEEVYNNTLKRKTTLSEDLNWLTQELTSGEDQSELLQRSIEEKQKRRQMTKATVELKLQNRQTLNKENEEIAQSVKELTRLHKGLTEGINSELIRVNRLEVEIDNRLNRLHEEYELTYTGAKETFPLVLSPEDARTYVKLTKLSIEELGNVNLGAIEEYDRVAERYEFLHEQQTDLLQAKKTLQEVIEEMDQEMSRRFGETFEQVKVHFTEVFKELFGGGRAELKLTDPTDLLHSGVDIVAQPPGKKLQNLGLMSGGERALTAIALLFSILKVRPVPFCILDEVEAALDEANVHRFSQYLHRFSQQSQFIVITHRKGTMEGADVLYGVTMQESGVSKLVSVRLEEEGSVQQLF